MRRMIGLLAVVVPSACTAGEPDPESASAVQRSDSAGVEIVFSAGPAVPQERFWHVGPEPLFVILGSDGTPENRLLDPTSIDTDTRGRIIVGDGNQAGWDAVLVYDSLGRFLLQAGREGQGPGEFGQLWWAESYRGDSIVAFDMSGDELAVFGPDGAFVRQLRTPSIPGERPAPGTYGFTAGADGAYGDGHFLAYPFGALNIEGGPGPAWYEHLLLRVAPDGESWDTLGTFKISQQYWSGTGQERLWFGPVSVRVVGEEDLYAGDGDRFEVRQYGPDGTLRRVIRRAHQPREVNEELRTAMKEWYLDRVRSSPEVNDQIVERIRLDLEDDRFAETLPPYSAVLLDDQGYLWVEEFRWPSRSERAPITEPTQWAVFDTTGAWVGNVETPAGFILHHVRSNRLLGFVIDELDVKEIHAYELLGRNQRRLP